MSLRFLRASPAEKRPEYFAEGQPELLRGTYRKQELNKVREEGKKAEENTKAKERQKAQVKVKGAGAIINLTAKIALLQKRSERGSTSEAKVTAQHQLSFLPPR
jgi:hypothetical protein